MIIESNVFPFLNLSELATQYRLYEIRGLKRNVDYYQNRQTLIHRLSYQLKHPVTIIELDGKPCLVVSADAPDVPDRFQLIRGVVYFNLTGSTVDLDYSLRTPENDEICLRFLRFMVQSALFENAQLWQPGSGGPFFEKTPVQDFGEILLFQGFSVRPTFIESGQLGVCVDVQHKFISKVPLPTYLTERTFQQYKAAHCIYHFGHQWYEIQLSEVSDLNVSEEMIPDGDNWVSLLEYAIKHSRKPIPEDLASIAQDASVVHYLTNQNEDRAAIAALCHLVYDSGHPSVQEYHPRTVLKPGVRRFKIHQSVEKYFQEITFGNVTLEVSPTPEQAPQKVFILPDYRFGNGHRLSVRRTAEAEQVTLDKVGQKRAELLSNPKVGMYVQERFDRQYLLLPQTVGDSFGSVFVEDLQKAVDRLYPAGDGYRPEVIYYPDRGFRTYIEQGKAILKTVEENGVQSGYAVVMLNPTSTLPRQHDPLAALVIRRLKDFDLFAATIHSAMGKDCYEQRYDANGQPFYAARAYKNGKLHGYLRNVALNKVLLTNEKWPFVLDTPLHADVIIGIDVKRNTAGYIVVNKKGDRIWSLPPVQSTQKEQLSSEQIRACLVEVLSKEAERAPYPLVRIVIHRDGRMYECEIEGAKQAVDLLKTKGILPENATLTILEISKSAPVSLRLFGIVGGSGQIVNNPQIASYRIVGNDGYLCATGRPFLRNGTVNPLHVRYVEGELAFESCLEDIF